MFRLLKTSFSVLLFFNFISSGLAFAEGRLGDLKIYPDRVPNWNPGVERGIPDTSGWNKIEANGSPYNVVGDGVTEVGTALQNALDAAAASGVPTVVHLDAGDYILGYGSHLVLASNVVLDGEGPESTRIEYYVRNGGSYAYRSTVIIGSDYAIYDYGTATPTTLTNDALKGDSSVITNSARGFSVDDWIIVAEIGKDPSMFQSYGKNGNAELISHIAQVKAIDGNIITFDRPLRINMRTEYSAQIRKLEMTENSGVQDIALIGNPNNETQGPVAFNFAVNCWLFNVELTKPFSKFLLLDHAARNTIKKVTFKGPSLQTSDINNYGVEVKEAAQDNLITNNIFDMLYTVLLFHEGASGNVASYNYVATTRSDDSGVTAFDMECHGQYPHENLFEGNDLLMGGRHDTYWGSNGPRNFWYRNRMFHGTGDDIKNGADGWYMATVQRNAPDDQTTLMLNSVNVMGINNLYMDTNKNAPETYDANEPDASADNLSYDHTNMWIERNLVTSTSLQAINIDPTPDTNVNYDLDPEPNPNTKVVDNYYGDSVPSSWDALNLPASLYLTERPNWWPFGKLWPGIGADVDEYEGVNVKLPAQDRFEGINNEFNLTMPVDFRIVN